MFDWIFQLLNHSWVPWITSGLILLWGLVQWFAMRRNLFIPLERPLSDAMSVLEEAPSEPITFRPTFAKIDKELLENSLVGDKWGDFTKTLIDSEDERVIHSTVRADRHFTLEKLIGNNLEDRYYRAIPGFLMGLGFFFTFVGLIAALWFASKGMASEDILEARWAMQGLLHVAAMKFLSSLAGFFAAMVFSWGERWQRHQLEQEVELFCQLLDGCFVHLTSERLVHEQLQQSRAQNRHLEKITGNLDSTIALPATGAGAPVQISLEPLLRAVREESERITRQLNDLTLKRLPEALGDRLQRPEADLAPALEEIASRLENAVLMLADKLGAEADRPLDLEPILDHFRREGERLLQANEETVEKMAAALRARQETTVSTTGGDEALPLLQEMTGRLETAITHLGEKLAGVPAAGVNLEPLLDHFRQEGERLLRANEAAMEKMAAAVEARGGGQAGPGLSTEQTELLHRIADKLDGAIDTLGRRMTPADATPALDPLIASVKQEGERLFQANEKTVEKILSMAQQQQEATVQTPSVEFLDLLGRIASQMETAVSALGDRGFNTLVDTLRQEGEKLAQTGEMVVRQFLDELTRGLGQRQGGLETEMMARLSALGEKSGADATALEPLLETVRLEREQWLRTSRETMAPMMVEMAREMGRQLQQHRQMEMERMERMAAEVSHSVSELNAKIGRVTPISLNSLVRTVSEKGERLHQTSEQILRQVRAANQLPPRASAHPAPVPQPVDDDESTETVTDTELMEVPASTEVTTPVVAERPAPDMERVVSQLEETVSALNGLTDRMAALEEKRSAGQPTNAAQPVDGQPTAEGLIRSGGPPRPTLTVEKNVQNLTERFMARQNRYRRHYRTKITYKSVS